MGQNDQFPAYVNLPYLSPVISPNDLDENGMIKNPQNIYEIDNKKYSVYASLGQGDFGEVTIAQDLSSGEWVALKMLRPDVSVSESENEYKLLQKAGMASAMESGVIVMSLISGKELYQFIDTLDAFKNFKQKNINFDSKLSISDIELLRIAIGMCDAVNDVNVNFGILLRDIKIQNFIYNFSTGKVVAIDYGSACQAGLDKDLVIYDTSASISPGSQAPESSADGMYSRYSESYSVGMAIADLYNLQDEGVLISPSEIRVMRIENQTMLEEILNIINKMTNLNEPENRIYLDEAAEALRKLHHKYTKNVKQDLNVCVIDLAELSALEDKDKINLITSIRNFDRILLVNSGPFLSTNEMLKFKLDIEKYLHSCSLAKISNTILSGLSHDDLIKSACKRMQLESRYGAYYFKFSEYKKESNMIYPIMVNPIKYKQAEGENVAGIQKQLEKNLSFEHSDLGLFASKSKSSENRESKMEKSLRKKL